MLHLDEGALQAWLDGDRSGLGVEERAEVETHLAVCEMCARRLEEMEAESRQVAGLLSGDDDLAESMPEFETVVERARALHHGGRRRRTWMGLGWAASIAVALGAGWMANDLSRRTDLAQISPPPQVAQPIELPPAVEDAPTAARDTERTMLVGRVTDEEGRPLPAAQVVVDGTRIGTLTQADGTFALVLDPDARDSLPEDVTVSAQLIGFRPDRRSVALRPGVETSADFRLEETAVALDQIVVTGVAGAAPKITSGPPQVTLSPGQDAGAWVEVSRSRAETAAGFRLVVVPDLPVVRIQVMDAGELVLVRVVQDLGNGEVLDMVEGEGAFRFDDSADDDGRTRASTRVGPVSVAAAANLPEDALQALLNRLR